MTLLKKKIMWMRRNTKHSIGNHLHARGVRGVRQDAAHTTDSHLGGAALAAHSIQRLRVRAAVLIRIIHPLSLQAHVTILAPVLTPIAIFEAFPQLSTKSTFWVASK